MNQIKKLPRDKDGNLLKRFKANGNNYVINDISEGLSIERFTTWQKFTLTVGFGLDFQTMYTNIAKAQQMVDKLVVEKRGLTELTMHLEAMKSSFTEDSDSRYDVTMYLCSIFINREDEDLTEWSTSLADEKIADWNAEGYDYQDFLVFALERCPGFKDLYQKTLGARETTI